LESIQVDLKSSKRPSNEAIVNGLTKKQMAELPEVKKLIQNKKPRAAETIINRLWNFHKFTVKNYQMSIDTFVQVLKRNGLKHDVYQVLNDYVTFRINEHVENISIGFYVRQARKFLVRNGISVPAEDFKENVDIPKKIRRQWYDIKKEMIEILQAPMSERLFTYLMCLAVTSMRPLEPLCMTLEDFDFNSDPATVFINGQFTKMKVDRKNFITRELVKVIKKWVDFKHRKRIIVNPITKERRLVEPPLNPKALLFAMRANEHESKPDSMYTDLLKEFSEVRSRLHMNQMEKRDNPNYHRHKITFQSFRRRAKKTIEKYAGWSYSEWVLGHYSYKDDYYPMEGGEEEAAQTFKDIEPYLTYLDVTALTEHNKVLEAGQRQLKEDLKETKVSTATQMEERDKVIAELQKKVAALEATSLKYWLDSAEQQVKSMPDEDEVISKIKPSKKSKS
jgi:integrase